MSTIDPELVVPTNQHRLLPRGAGMALVVLLLLPACATEVHSSSAAPPATASMNLPRPRRVLVADFAVDPSAVQQDQGIGERLQREMSGGDPSQAQAATASEVQTALGGALLGGLTGAGLPAETAAAGGTDAPGDLLVQGHIDRIDEGNRTRRLAVGFGAGKSIVTADAQLYYVMPDGQPMLLRTYEGKSDSGRKPGMAAGASSALGGAGPGMGAVSAALGVSADTQRSPVAKEAARLKLDLPLVETTRQRFARYVESGGGSAETASIYNTYRPQP